MPESLPSQQLLSVDRIRGGTLLVKGGGLRSVLLASGLNFALKSEAEQQAIIAGFQEFLSSLDFSLEVVAHSRRVNIDDYLNYISEITQSETNELMKLQAQEYLSFVRSFLDLYSVMEKKFFVVVPYNPVTVTKESLKGGVSQILQRQKPTVTVTEFSAEEFARHQAQLQTRVDEVRSGLERLGIRVIPLGTEELIELLYNLYNPQAREKQKLEARFVPEGTT
jgi:hypothetical protein